MFLFDLPQSQNCYNETIGVHGSKYDDKKHKITHHYVSLFISPDKTATTGSSFCCTYDVILLFLVVHRQQIC